MSGMSENSSESGSSSEAERRSRPFGVGRDQLEALMRLPGAEAKAQLEGRWAGISGLCRQLRTDPFQGVLSSQAELAQRQQCFGANRLTLRQPEPLSRVFSRSVTPIKPLYYAFCVLFVGFAVYGKVLPTERSARQRHYVDYAIQVCVSGVALVTLGTTFHSLVHWYRQRVGVRRANARLADWWTRCIPRECSCIRNGQPMQVRTESLVCGDVVQVQKGDRLPADGVLLQAWDLQVEETGPPASSRPVRKSRDAEPLLFAGSTVVDGSAKYVVVAVGAADRLASADQGKKQR